MSLTATLFVLTGTTDQATDRNTIVFKLKLVCERNPDCPKDAKEPSQLYLNHELLSSHLIWEPQGEQAEVFAENPPAPTNPNIVLAKLRPGQEVDIEVHALKSVGKDHAKFSPVGALKPPKFLNQLSQISYLYSYRIISFTPPHQTEPPQTHPPTPSRQISKMFFSRRHSR